VTTVVKQGLKNPKYLEQFREVSVSQSRPFVLSKMAYWRAVTLTLWSCRL